MFTLLYILGIIYGLGFLGLFLYVAKDIRSLSDVVEAITYAVVWPRWVYLLLKG